MEPYLPNYLKGKNRRLVFDLLRERGQMSRAEITRDTGMSFPTAMKVVDAFLEKGLLVELDETGPAAGAGRKGRLLRFEPGAYRAVGVECEGRFARVGLADMAGGVQARETIELGDFARTRDLSPPCGGHPAHVRCGKRRSCSGRVHRLSRQPGPGRGGHRQLRGHGHPAAHLLCAGIPRVLAGSGAARLSGKRCEPRLRGRGIPAARRGRSGQYALSVHRLGLRRRGAPRRKTAPRRGAAARAR